MRRCLMTRQRRWATSMPKPRRGKQDCGSRDASRLGRSCSAMERWAAGEVAAWAAGTPGLGTDIAAVLRDCDIDGESLASLTEDDMQALGIEPFGRRRRITMRVIDARAAMLAWGAPPAAAAAPATDGTRGGTAPAAAAAPITGGIGGGAPPAAKAAPATGGSGGGAPPAAAASPATGGVGGGAPPRPRRPPATGGRAVGPRPPATPPPSDLVAAAGPRPPRMPPTWPTLHEDEGGAKGKKGRRKRGQGLAQASAIGRGPYPIGARPRAASSAEEDDQPRAAEGSLGARSRKRTAPTFRETNRGSRGGRSKRRVLPSATSEVSSNEVLDDVLRSA